MIPTAAYIRWTASIPAEELKAIRDKHDAVHLRMTKAQLTTMQSIFCKRYHTRSDVNVLVDMGYDTSMTLGLACKLGHVAAVDTLLARGVSIPINAINEAIFSENLVIIVTILEAGCCRTPQMYGLPSPMETALKTQVDDNILSALETYGINCK